jgi:predicted nucleic acid-binding protein
MSAMIVVSNSTPIISLATVGQIALFEALFGRVYIPREVERELKDNQYPGHDDIDHVWCTTKDVQGTLYVGFLCHDLDRGEAEAITLAKELHADTLILDERTGYKIAKQQGLHVIGTLTVLLMAKQHGLIPSVRPILDEMIQKGRWYSQAVYRSFLRQIGE